MTCVLAWIDEKKNVNMLGDTQGTSTEYHLKEQRRDTKVFRNGELLFGFTTSYRKGQIIKHHLKVPKPDGVIDHETFEKYLVTELVPSMRDAFEEHYLGDWKTKTNAGCQCVVGYNGMVAGVHSDMQVTMPCAWFVACGSGGTAIETAIEAHRLYNGLTSPPSSKFIGFATAAMDAVCVYNITVGGEYTHLVLPPVKSK